MPQHTTCSLLFRALLQIGVHAYIQLLHAGGDRNSSLYAKEVVRDGSAVVPQLLSHEADAAEEAARATLGLELLAHFLAVQSASDYATSLAKHVKSTCAPAVVPALACACCGHTCSPACGAFNLQPPPARL